MNILNTSFDFDGEAVFYSARELAQRGKDNIPSELISNQNLIYSSPATLAFNSPGAEGFGVKRAGLAVPGSVMLIVSPGCCGRNTSGISEMPGYKDRFFYLTMSETDIITSRHLKKIPQAVREITEYLEELGKKPEIVMICITCVDALLGTDMESVCKACEEVVDIPVKPCYMYALTREGRKPPMVHVRQSIYSLLEPMKKKGNVVDILGYFAPLDSDCEIYEILKSMGVKEIKEISRCSDLSDFKRMAQANFALVLNPEARPAARDLEKRLVIPSIELSRFYDIERIRKQYCALSNALGQDIDDDKYYSLASESINKVKEALMARNSVLNFSIGECINADPFELALALTNYGFGVEEIFGTLKDDNFFFLNKLAQTNPDVRVYSNLHPSMIYYKPQAFNDLNVINISLGKDSGFYHKDYKYIAFNSDIQPFGYRGVIALMEQILEVIR